MKLRRIALVLALVALMVLGLASCVKNANTTTTPGGTQGGDGYYVSFDGVTGVPAQFVPVGSTATEPTKPTKENYNFDGWYVDGQKWNFTKPVEGTMTLTAQFSPKSFDITYDLGGVAAENNNPLQYTFSEENDIYLAPLTDPADAMFFLGWSKPCIAAGTAGEQEIKANWIAKEKVLRNYGFEANDAASGKTYIHYSEMQGDADDDSTWWTAPNGTKQYYASTTGTGGSGLFIKAEWTPRLNHSVGTSVFEGWKNLNSLPTIMYGKDAAGNVVNAWFSTTYGPSIVTGFQTVTEGQPYSVSAFFYLTGAKEAGVEDVIINVDFRMIGEGAFPINFYLRGGSNYDNGQNRVNAFYIDGNGDIVVGEDTINAKRVVYKDGSGNPIERTVIGNVGGGEWHTLSIEMTQASGGYDVVIKADGVKLGNTLSMKTNINFSGETALTQLMIFGGDASVIEAVEAMAAAKPNYTCTYEFDNFVFYAK